MPCGQSVLFLCYLSQQYSQNVVFVPIVSVLRSIVVNGKYPKGEVVYRIGNSDSIKGLLRVLCVLVVQMSLQPPTSDLRSLTSDLRPLSSFLMPLSLGLSPLSLILPALLNSSKKTSEANLTRDLWPLIPNPSYQS